MDFQGLSNVALWRLRQRGVNFGGAPTNLATDQNPPAAVGALLNQGYAEFTKRTTTATGSAMPPIKVSFPTTLNATAYPLRPIPPNGGTINPAALAILEVTYTINGGAEYPVALVNTEQFQDVTGGYVRRLSWFGGRTLYATRLYRRMFLDVAPGTATVGDFLNLMVIPDIANAPNGLTCANGGPMVNPTDVPLLYSEHHLALVEYVVMNAGDAVDMESKVAAAAAKWRQYIADALGDDVADGGIPSRSQDRFAGITVLD